MDMRELFHHLIDSGELSCADRIDLPARQERTTDIPSAYRSGLPGRWLTNDDKLKGRLWLHQAKAMEAAEQGRNVVISTGTASGKSLIFQSVVLRALDKSDEATAIVFYPLKALAGDQLVSWRRVAELAGLSEKLIAEIHGGVPYGERGTLLGKARIVLMTPDVCHAWLLREVSNPVHRDFLARIALVVIDEAHIFEGVFGSNFAYFFRRLCAARSLARPNHKPAPLQTIAASATISKSEEHLHTLTGLRFEKIREDDDGSPHCPRSIVHICARKGEEMSVAEPLLAKLVDDSDDGSFITFIDSRQGSERFAVRIDRGELVKPYRSGYEPDDRMSIESALRDGRLRGVVSTSALELGIDIPHFSIGLNFGVPASRKSFRQRLGRVGRQRSGTFAILAEPYAFGRFGMTLRDYYEASIEPSYLYLRNRFVQYAHARCLAEELEMLGVTGRKKIPSTVSWPNGLAEKFDFSYQGSPSARPREFDSIRQIGGDSPHVNYRLRNVPEEAFSIAHGRGDNPVRIGQPLNLQQAIREAFPGAVYLHMAEGYRVHQWKSTPFGRSIRVSPTSPHGSPKPIIRTFVNMSLDQDGLIDGRFRQGENGFLSECHLQIAERVVGFREGSKRNLYKDLRKDKPGMTPKTREFYTTGVVVKIEMPWFQQAKKDISSALHQLLLREYSISPRDVDATATNISLIRGGRRQPVSDAIVFFDAAHGSLRLAEPAYLQFGHLLNRLERAGEMTPPGDDLLSRGIVSKLRLWFEQLGEQDGLGLELNVSGLPTENEGWYQVYAVGSVVTKRDTKGVHRDIEIIGHELVDLGDNMALFYRYKLETEGKAMVPAEKVHPVGDDWDVAWWNPATGEVRESLDDAES